MAAIALGLVAGAAFAVVPNGLDWTTRAVLTWDLACGFFVGATLLAMRGRDTASMQRSAAFEDEGGRAILVLTIAATAASLAAVAAELHGAKGENGGVTGLRVAIAFFTVALSWTFVHLIFALHYAHEFYGPARGGKGTRGGLAFPGDQTPDYWDFLHFSFIIGVASQTADIQITSKVVRRLSTTHSLTAFGFNTVVLALTINLLASLF